LGRYEESESVVPRYALHSDLGTPASKLAGDPGPSAERKRPADVVLMARLKPCP